MKQLRRLGSSHKDKTRETTNGSGFNRVLPKQDSLGSSTDSRHDHINAPRIIIVGPDRSGKSSVFKQLELRFGNGLELLELEVLKEAVHRTIIENIQALLKQADKSDLDFKDDVELKDELVSLELSASIDERVGEMLKQIWASQATQMAWKNRDKNIADSLEYFMQDLKRIADPEYVPTPTDYLKTTSRTSTLKAADIYYKGDSFRIHDTASENSFFRNARKQKALLDKVFAAVFTVAASEYDHLDAIETAERLFKQFLEIIEAHDSNIKIFLLFNKSNLLREKLRSVPFKSDERFPDYSGPTKTDTEESLRDVENGVFQYLRKRFIPDSSKLGITALQIDAMDEKHLVEFFAQIEKTMSHHIETHPKVEGGTA